MTRKFINGLFKLYISYICTKPVFVYKVVDSMRVGTYTSVYFEELIPDF